MNITCLKCKGRGYCGRVFCPHIARSEAMFKVKDKLPPKDFFGASPAPFVGRAGYPSVNIGILTPPDVKEEAWLYDAPNHWAQHNFQIPEIVEYRSSLVNSRQKSHVKHASKFVELGQEIGMASRPVEVEVNLKDTPRFRFRADSDLAPMGPNAEVISARITSNPHIDTRVDKVVSDTDLKAGSAVTLLYDKGFDENFLSKVLSVGNLGVKRKLVPTRWSITAVDDTLAKHLMDDVKQFPQSDYSAFFGGYLGNYYLILLFPDVFAYELFEMYAPRASWNATDEVQYSTDHEFFDGRKEYAENCAGGYYAARLAVLESMSKRKHQASCLALRFITGEYAVPLGVWVVREATRKAMSSKPIEFATKELMLKYAKILAKKKFGIDLTGIIRESKILLQMKTQSKLSQWVG